jgi:hypothetical protein
MGKEKEKNGDGEGTAFFLVITHPFSPLLPTTFPPAVVLWELFTQKEPWADFSSVQVVGQVGFGGARLPIPEAVPPPIAGLIERCWADDPVARPEFGGIIDSLTDFLRAEAAAARGAGGGGGGAGG